MGVDFSVNLHYPLASYLIALDIELKVIITPRPAHDAEAINSARDFSSFRLPWSIPRSVL